MADKKLQDLNNTRTSVVAGDQIVIGGTDGFTYKAALTVLQGFLLENSLTTSTIKAPQSAIVKAAIDAINIILTTDNTSFDNFQKITNAIVIIQTTLSVDDANYDTLQKIVDKLKVDFAKITHYEFALLAPQSVFNIAHNRNAFITSIKFSSGGNSMYDGVVVTYTETDANNVSFTLDTPLQTGAKIKIQFNL